MAMLKIRWTLPVVTLVILVIAMNIIVLNIISKSPPPAPTSQTCASSNVTAIIKEISADSSTLQIQCSNEEKIITVEASDLNAALKYFGKGDRVDLEYSSEAGKTKLQSLSVSTYSVRWETRILAILDSFLILLLVFCFLLRCRLGSLIIGADNRYSNSKTQIVLWFFVWIIAYVASIVLRGWYGGIDFVGGVASPQNLLVLSGLSAITFAAAKGITVSQIEQNKEKETSTVPPSLGQLFEDDKGKVDLGDFQMIIVTLLAVCVYLCEVFGFLGTIEFHRVVTLPDVDTTILAAFGLGQGAYLAKKFVSPPRAAASPVAGSST